MQNTVVFFKNAVWEAPSDFQFFFRNSPMYKILFFFLFLLWGVARGAHLPMIIWCLLLWAWFAQILMVSRNLGTHYKLDYPIVFCVFLWGCIKGGHLPMFIYCLLSWAWLAQIFVFGRKCWSTQFCHGCVLGWLGLSKSLAHALICLVLYDDIC